ncbi:MAG TPA: VTT domain-containing protein [Microthrixaceae bacterium]|nr:VTT domain-containing protein [Microthrixaceae bacterium]HMV73988.1 VTT domain-containing protein [Microthrixaceae bacterium]HMX07046.1 VTT domain-containing protein [Microthrixaceae bacterium]HMX65073.1 VTT domain-containing protein [Microthrixaceae bacterium]HMY88173.1 VTT domain-containing protein [Microthrixaceae bacterium]
MLNLAPLFALLPDWLDPEKIISRGGYLLIFAIVFAESGLLIGFFLPGDSLLFTAGMFAAGTFEDKLPNVQFNIWVLCLGVFIAAVAGDQVGYLFGRKAGPALFSRPDSRFFKQEHLEKAQSFFEHHGPRAIVLARFVPIVRTFCPIVAGAGQMEYGTFVRFNVVGGFLWSVGVTLLGYFLGNVPLIADNIELALLMVVAVSLIPIAIEVIKSRRAKKAHAAG